jgi:two-component system sensor histidine kinase HydH
MTREQVKTSQNVAAAIAHELRNPVFGIASAAQLLRYRITDDPVMEKNIGRILRDTERLNNLVEALLEYGRPAPVRLAPCDPDQTWTDVLQLQRGLLESKALLVNYTPASPRAVCSLDAEQFAQACASALSNAIEAAPEGSDLAIISSTRSDGSWHSTLRNEGAAIPDELLPRVFDPLVSSKPGHAGIGLATARRILTEHGGTIALESDVVVGTTVALTLPASRLP